MDRNELKQRLTREQYQVTQQKGTERPFSGELWNNKESGVYRCVVCDAELFDSGTKFESGTGWPSFYDAMDKSQAGDGDGLQPRDGAHGGDVQVLRGPSRTHFPGRAPAHGPAVLPELRVAEV